MIKIDHNINEHIVKSHLTKICFSNISESGRELKILPKYLSELIEKDILQVGQVNAVQALLDAVLHDTESIISGRPEFLDAFRNNFEELFAIDLDTEIPGGNKPPTLRKHLSTVFYYSDYDRWDAYNLAKELNVNICPYCNRIPTYTIGNSKKKGTRPQFDHFFDKATFPYLSLSIYNLVPSCNICNTNFKGTKKFTLSNHFHPYIKGFDCEEIKFSIEIADIDSLLSTLNDNLVKDYEIVFKSINGNLPANIEDLGLLKLYNYDKTFTNEMIKKSFIYNNDYIDAMFSEWEGTLFHSKEEIKQIVMGNYLNLGDINKRALGKLTKDITDELGIFK